MPRASTNDATRPLKASLETHGVAAVSETKHAWDAADGDRRIPANKTASNALIDAPIQEIVRQNGRDLVQIVEQ